MFAFVDQGTYNVQQDMVGLVAVFGAIKSFSGKPCGQVSTCKLSISDFHPLCDVGVLPQQHRLLSTTMQPAALVNRLKWGVTEAFNVKD